MNNKVLWIWLLWVVLLAAGCVTGQREVPDPLAAQQIEGGSLRRNLTLSREIEERILSLNPCDLKEKEIREVLSQAAAPRIINIHGGVLPVQSSMVSFSKFLIGMGYPETSIRNPGNGSYTFGYYDSSEKIAGAVAWYYEKEGLRPMIVGHSQGGILTVKVLHKLAGDAAKRLPVWNPLTRISERRNDITDPLTGATHSIAGLQLCYATAVGAGGLARILPHQWSMNRKLRKIPDSVEEFTGFHKGLDPLGGDFLGYGPANNYKPIGHALVRNVRLPSAYWHSTIPNTQHLVKSQQIRDWINNYRPTGQPIDTPHLAVQFDADTSNILWAADVWYSIKKHWVLELQRIIRANRALHQRA